jgi:hypothetical protein
MITIEKLKEIIEKIKKEDDVEMIDYGDCEREPEFIPDYYEDGTTDMYIISFLVKREEEEEEDSNE